MKTYLYDEVGYYTVRVQTQNSGEHPRISVCGPQGRPTMGHDLKDAEQALALSRLLADAAKALEALQAGDEKKMASLLKKQAEVDSRLEAERLERQTKWQAEQAEREAQEKAEREAREEAERIRIKQIAELPPGAFRREDGAEITVLDRTSQAGNWIRQIWVNGRIADEVNLGKAQPVAS